jgi:hypothetical protein
MTQSSAPPPPGGPPHRTGSAWTATPTRPSWPTCGTGPTPCSASTTAATSSATAGPTTSRPSGNYSPWPPNGTAPTSTSHRGVGASNGQVAGSGVSRPGNEPLSPRDVRYRHQGAAARKRGCHRQTVERPQRTQPQADHCRSNRRSRPQDGGTHRYQAPSGKPDPRLEADVDHSGGTRQLRRGRAAVILRFRAATVRRRRQAGSSGRGLSDQLSAQYRKPRIYPVGVDRRS